MYCNRKASVRNTERRKGRVELKNGSVSDRFELLEQCRKYQIL